MRNANLHTRAARARLPQRRKPHWATLRPGQLHLGYCRPKPGMPGYWTVRHYLGSVAGVAQGKRGGHTPYRVARLPGVADDFEDANGHSVLSFAQAQHLALLPPTTTQCGKLTVAQVCSTYVIYLADGGREQAASAAASRLRLHVLSQLGHVQISALTPEQLRGWLATLAKRLTRAPDEEAVRRARVSANRILATLRAALNHAYAEGMIESDRAWRRRVAPFKNVDAARKQYLSVDEACRLINASQGAFRWLVQAALHTGARYGELTRLKVHDFDPDGGTLSIVRSKSGKSRRVHLTEEGEAFFLGRTVGRAGNALLLPHDDGEAWRRSNQQSPMRQAVTRAGISPAVSFHGLRHTYCSLAIMGGVPLQVVAENLGHADTRMVEKHYGHLAESHKRAAIRAGAPQFGILADGKVTALRARR